MAVKKPLEGHANLYVTNLRRELKNLFDALVEIENIDSATLFEAMLYPYVKNWVDQRERNLDIDQEITESLHHAIDEAFINKTVMHRCLYKSIDSVNENEHEQVLAKMKR